MIPTRSLLVACGAVLCLALGAVLAAPVALAQAEDPRPTGAPSDGADSEGVEGKPAEKDGAGAATDEEDTLPEDRPFLGDPGGEPPPPPVRPEPPRREEPPARPEPPRRPAEKPPTVPEPPKDLLEPPGPNILTGQVGASAGLTRHSVGGFQLNLGWSYQMSRILWFDVIGNVSFGGNCRPVETDDQGRILDSDCGAFRGIGIDLLAGVQLKFVQLRSWTAPVVPFVRFAAGAAFIITDTPNDGAALVFRAGGGARYYFSPRFSVGGELAVTMGPAWRNHLPGGVYAAIALLGGVEFLL